MLSILIPVYNFDIRALVSELHRQITNEKVQFEIIILDDATNNGLNISNRQITSLQNVTYTELSKNIGRSKIRNRLSSFAKYDYLLFMDADAQIPSRTFIADYLCECNGDVVVCGGMEYAPFYKEYSYKDQYGLRLNYGKNRECKTAKERNLIPNKSFMTFNFLISKSIFNKILFDESLSNYGHEDTLFGLELKHQGIIIKHINNPLRHLEIDSNSIFLTKALASVKNIFSIVNRNSNYKDLYQDVKLLKYYAKVKTLGLTPIIEILYKLTHRSIERNLVNKGQNLLYFDLLRLGFLCTLK